MSRPRGDAALVRHINACYGLETARAWQALPYLLRPDDPFGEHISAHHADLVQRTATRYMARCNCGSALRTRSPTGTRCAGRWRI
jgi:hypothetical protein